MIQPLPCPFCGASAIPDKWESFGRAYWGVICESGPECGVHLDCRKPTEAEATEAWNCCAQDKSVTALEFLVEQYASGLADSGKRIQQLEAELTEARK